MFRIIAFSCILSWLFQTVCVAQPAKFGNVPITEILQTHYPLDSSANAAILSDVGTSYLEFHEGDGFVIRHQRKTRIKIYNTEGLSWADVSVPYYRQDSRNMELVKDIKASTYNLKNDKIVTTELDKKAVYDNNINENWSEKVFALPDVKPGSVIEYEYFVYSPFIRFLRDWNFQYDIPVKWSEYEIKVPAFYQYQMVYQGFEELVIRESELLAKEQLYHYEYNRARYKWACKEVPAFRDEPYITTREDYLAKVMFQLSSVDIPGRVKKEYMTSWPKLVEDYLDISDAGKYLKKKDGQDIVPTLTQQKQKTYERMQAVHDYVRSHIAWNKTYGIYPTQSPGKLLDTKSGNAADINILLTNLLNMAGVEAHLALLSTRDHGHVTTKFPLLQEFNYALVVATIDDMQYILDATDPELPMGLIPTQCINGYALVMKPGDDYWVSLSGSSIYSMTTNVICQYDTAAGQFMSTVINDYQGYAAALKRKEIKQKDIVEIADGKGLEKEKIQIANMNDVERPLRLSAAMPYDFEGIGDHLYISTAMFSNFSEQPFKSPERNFPVDFGFRHQYKFTFSLTIPKGYTVEEMPADVHEILEDKSVQFIWRTQTNNIGIQILSMMQINKPIVDAKYYQELKKLFTSVMSKYAEKIVLKKTEG